MLTKISLKAAALLAAGSLAVGGGAVAAAGGASAAGQGLSAVASGWGQKVSEKVEACKQLRTAEHRGIGACVSAFARTHGKTVSAAAHARNEAREADREGDEGLAKGHGRNDRR